MELSDIVKIIIVGEAGVGKSSIMTSYCDKFFSTEFISTIGVDFRIREISTTQNMVKLHIWDTAGQERFLSITKSYFRGSHVIIVVFDLTNIVTFNKVTKWIKEIESSMGSANYRILLVGNKCEKNGSCDFNLEVETLVKKYKLEYFSTSAKSGANINEIFERAAEVGNQICRENNSRDSDYTVNVLKKRIGDKNCCM